MYRSHWNHTSPVEMPHSPVEQRWRSTLSAVSLTFGILASAVFALRVYASRSASCKMRAEDVLMGISVVLMWGTVASVLMKAYNGIGLPGWQIPPEQKHLLNLGSFLVPKFWASSTACCKVAIILFLRRVVGFTRSINTTLVVVAVVSVLWAVAAILFSTFVCMPISFYWDKSSHNGHCMPKDHYLLGNIVFAVMNMVGDITILVIPLPTLWKSQMPKKQKIAITGILSIGLIVCIFSLMRVVQFFYFDLDHISTSSALETLWTTLENEFAVICGCAPQLAPLFRGLQSSRSCKTKSSGYAGMYDTSVLGKHAKMSIIHTTVSGTAAGEAILGLRTAMRDGRSSSEVELKGIEVHTAIDQEISADGCRHHDPGRLLTVESGRYTRI
ncbi:hypothetical protein BB8028_0002g15430 [Beauveria bassiana]|uniref:Rhodopsin domain-containing protein n=1 Tax=Beauveria bassiana TaxID=176275 RepID=A0A2S7Y535_BEABA|nr:hypothetical protein BB8028_0002g15430 [Beauveria bassiana]